MIEIYVFAANALVATGVVIGVIAVVSLGIHRAGDQMAYRQRRHDGEIASEITGHLPHLPG